MKGLLTTFKKDMKLALRSFYMYIVLIFVLMFVAIMLFVVKDDTDASVASFGSKVYLYVADKPGLETAAENLLSEAGKEGIIEIVSSEDEMVQLMEKNRTSIGMIIDLEGNQRVFEYKLQGYEGETLRNMMELETKAEIAREYGAEPNTTVTYLKGENAQKLSVKKLSIPIFLVMESGMLGMFLVAAYVFIEKQEGTIKAFSVSPGKLWQFLLSKIMMFMVFGWISGFVAIIALLGFDYNFLHVFLLLTAFNIFGTLLGLLLAAFFDSLQSSMMTIILVAAIIGVATVSYMMPSFSPLVVRWMPTYPIQFAFKEALFSTGNTAYIWQNILGYFAGNALLFMVILGIYKKRVSRL